MRRNSKRDLSRCPATDCTGGHSQRQHRITDAQCSLISSSARKLIDHNREATYRCNYCGCVYLRRLVDTEILGYLDNGLADRRWLSQYFP